MVFRNWGDTLKRLCGNMTILVVVLFCFVLITSCKIGLSKRRGHSRKHAPICWPVVKPVEHFLSDYHRRVQFIVGSVTAGHVVRRCIRK